MATRVLSAPNFEQCVQEGHNAVSSAKRFGSGEDFIGECKKGSTCVCIVVYGHSGSEAAQHLASCAPGQIVDAINSLNHILDSTSTHTLIKSEIENIMQQLDREMTPLIGGAVYAAYANYECDRMNYTIPFYSGDAQIIISNEENIYQSTPHVATLFPPNAEHDRVVSSGGSVIINTKNKNKSINDWYRDVLWTNIARDDGLRAHLQKHPAPWVRRAATVSPIDAAMVLQNWEREIPDTYILDKQSGNSLAPSRSLGEGIKHISAEPEFMDVFCGQVAILIASDGLFDVLQGPRWVFCDLQSPQERVKELVHQVSTKDCSPTAATNAIMQIAINGWREHHFMSVTVHADGFDRADDIAVHTNLLGCDTSHSLDKNHKCNL